LRGILRSEEFTNALLKESIILAMDLKPEKHYFYDKSQPQPVRLMNMTGG
jgi:cyclic pyranopterin phosphate synthase